MAKTVVCPSAPLRERHTTVRGSLVSACEAGMKRTYFREGNDGYILEELGKALAKRGNRIAEKWWGSTGSPTENLYLDNCLKKRLQRQWYGGRKENALLGNFQHAP